MLFFFEVILDLIKIENVYTLKDTIIKMKQQATD